MSKGKEDLKQRFDNAESIHWDESFALRETPDFETLPALDRKLYNKLPSDIGNTERLVTRYGKNMAFVKTSGWFAWDKKRWSLEDGDKYAYLFAEKTARDLKGEAIAMRAAGPYEDETPKQFQERIKKFQRFALNSGNKTKINAMVDQAKCHLWQKPDIFNQNKNLFNVQNGTLNLEAEYNGEESFDGIVLQKHSRKDFITKVANVQYDPNAPQPQNFLKFIYDILPDDEIRNFMQRFCGYCLTGDTSESIVAMFWGGGSNGKSTLIDIIDYILGDYAMTTPFGTVLQSDKGSKGGGDATPDLARLPGARFVSAAEPDTGARLSEGAVKKVTGSDVLPARHLNKDFFEYVPQFKLVLSFNNKPYIRGQDEGIWRRLILIPFEQRFVDEELLDKNPHAKPKIKNLDKAMRKEASGILNWMLDGYRLWAETGLKIPEKIRAITDEYRQDSNPIYDFLSSWCVRDPKGTIQAKRCYTAYKLWCSDNGVDPISFTAFGTWIKDMNFEKTDGRLIFYKGLALTPDAETRMIDIETSQYRNRYEKED
jgi:putative DNA primase/helicase